MGYYTRVLTTRRSCVPASFLEEAIAALALAGSIDLQGQAPEDWSDATLRKADGTPIAQIERSPVENGSLGEEELEEFRE